MKLKVTRIGDRYHARLIIDNDVVFDEMACSLKRDIGWICREMLRWYSKLGGVSEFAESARDRQRKTPCPVGKVWYRNSL
jgi:hypothetical protein